MLLFLNVIYLIIAIAMIAMILMQRGAGAQAGAGFGGGASATVFGARGASSFLSKSTKWLAITFFCISMFMAWQATKVLGPAAASQDLGVMSQVPVAPALPQENAAVPATIPATPEQATPVPVQAPIDADGVPAVPADAETPKPVGN
ncbi:preprotein translocase subunit SecG [Lysobacter sp. A286]